MMTWKEVIKIYDLLTNHDVMVWVDGGWGVDALLEKQTRNHEDLDIVIQNKDALKLRELLKLEGYKDINRDDATPWNFVLGKDKDCVVDVHVIAFDSEGNGLYGPAKRGTVYPAKSLKGEGKIGGRKVKCLTPEYQVESHTGYEISDKDFKDVSALYNKFNIDIPQEYFSYKNIKS